MISTRVTPAGAGFGIGSGLVAGRDGRSFEVRGVHQQLYSHVMVELQAAAELGVPVEPEMHQIGQVAAAVGLSLRTIRHYEEVDLVPPSGRSAGGFRLYTDDDIERLRLVKHMKPLDLTLEEMRELLEVRNRLAADATAAEADRGELLARLAMFATAAEQRCEALRELLQAAQSTAEMLRREAAQHRRAAGARR